jgi:DNA-directed RNA polymerase specialized sigma24 family protein
VADAVRASARLAVLVPELPDLPDDQPGPEEIVLARWEGEQVRRALAQLPSLQRRLRLRVVSGLTAAKPAPCSACRPRRSGSRSTGRWPGCAGCSRASGAERG